MGHLCRTGTFLVMTRGQGKGEIIVEVEGTSIINATGNVGEETILEDSV